MLRGWLFVRHLIPPFVAPGTNASARAGPKWQMRKSHTWEPTLAVRRSAGPDRSLGPNRRGSCRASPRSEEHTSELQSLAYLVCRLLLEKKKKTIKQTAFLAIKLQSIRGGPARP